MGYGSWYIVQAAMTNVKILLNCMRMPKSHSGLNGRILNSCGKIIENTKNKCSVGGAHGGCFQDLETCEIKVAQGMDYDVYLLGLAFGSLRFFTTSLEIRAVDRSVFYDLSARPAPPAPQTLSHNLRRHRSPSRRRARGCVPYFLCPA